jgi:hypothetical protein
MQPMQRGQRPPGDINAQTDALLAAIQQQADQLGRQPQAGQATFQRGEPATPEQLARARATRGRPQAPPPMEAVRAKTEPVSQAQQAGYQGRDTGEAREWMSAVRKGLDMSQGGRIQRAQGQGWLIDMPLYHGTGFDVPGFDIGKGGTLTGAPSARKAVWLSDNPDSSDLYAVRQMEDVLQEGGFNRPDLVERYNKGEITRDQMQEIMRAESVLERPKAARQALRKAIDAAAGENVGGLFTNYTANSVDRLALGRNPAKEAAQFFDENHADLRLPVTPAHNEIRQKFIDLVLAKRAEITFQQRHAFASRLGGGETYEPNTFSGGANIIPVYVRLKNPLIIDQAGEMYRENTFNDLIDRAIAAGHDGLIVRNTYDPFAMNAVAVFDPANIRSVHAAFDPDEAGSSNLLAGVGVPAGAIGLGMAAAQGDGERVD